MNEGSRFVVLDTNVVLDLLHFDDTLTRPLRTALEAGELRGAASEATFAEWTRVLAYPVFGLAPARQAELTARYRAWCDFFAPPPVPGVACCRDRDDQKFLEIAAGLAIPLVSRDRAILQLRRRRNPLPRIFSPLESCAWLAERP
ncbi:MAG: PIN domain-containing protein [Thiobacillus sp.]|nr:PIN domain-containing protein [Thiobacillus sp.]